MLGKIVIRGARVHNLKNLTVEIPRDRLVVITGVSGSGKSSLAFDTIYAEGKRRYVESLSAYAHQFLGQMGRSDADSIEGLSPAIAIEQKSSSANPRSTVGTATEIYDYLRLLFARIGKPTCFRCGREISAQTIQQIVDRALSLPEETRVNILAPIATEGRGSHRRELSALERAGFARVKIDGRSYELGTEFPLDNNSTHDIDLIVDRLVLRKGIEKRLADSLEIASRYGNEIVKVEIQGNDPEGKPMLFSLKFACAPCGVSLPEVSPRAFSFNIPQGACPACRGLGVQGVTDRAMEDLEPVPSAPRCRKCNGTRLRKESLCVKIAGKNIAEVSSLSVDESLEFFTSLALSRQEEIVAREILKEILGRLQFMGDVGLNYLSVDRASHTLSGGEAQRIRLATQIGSRLSGVVYILDEPTVGLHPRDNARLLGLLRQLRDSGNTVLVVEHDREMIQAADHVIDMGPGAGVHGGRIVAQGTPKEISENPQSLTGKFLSGSSAIPTPRLRRRGSGKHLLLKGASQNNLKNITAAFPIGAMTCVTGVSGSGKSTLVVDTLYKATANLINRSKQTGGSFSRITGWQQFQRVINIDQSQIGRSPRSNPATYTGLFDSIRDLFAKLPEARTRGYLASRFSFNVKGGRCEACKGEGMVRIAMHFLPDVFVTCTVCNGLRYNRESLEILYKGRSIADVLDLTVNQALEFMGNVPLIRQKLESLRDVGMGYIRLGQSAITLSGGEAQRIKLACELGKGPQIKTLYILDEPTTGLHFDDIQKLMEALTRLVEAGNTVILIEHNLDVIKSVDYIIDMGPEGGAGGGEIIAQGSPEEIINYSNSNTALFLKSF